MKMVKNPNFPVAYRTQFNHFFYSFNCNSTQGKLNWSGRNGLRNLQIDLPFQVEIHTLHMSESECQDSYVSSGEWTNKNAQHPHTCYFHGDGWVWRFSNSNEAMLFKLIFA